MLERFNNNPDAVTRRSRATCHRSAELAILPMLANEIEGATSGERPGDLERLGDHLTSRTRHYRWPRQQSGGSITKLPTVSTV